MMKEIVHSHSSLVIWSERIPLRHLKLGSAITHRFLFSSFPDFA